MATTTAATRGLYGLMAEFEDPDAIVAAARRAREAGYTRLDGYSPYPMEELIEALAVPRTILPWIVLAGGIAGCAGGFALQIWISVIDYPLNIGGRPYLSLPAFVVPSFETTILLGAIAAVVGMIALNGLPRPYHPVFNVPSFSMASSERFFLCIEAADPRFDREQTRRFLESLGPVGVSDVAE